jgi:hypothetical protein
MSASEKILRDGKGAPLTRLRRYFQELIVVFGRTAPISGCLLGNLSLELADHSDSIQTLLRPARPHRTGAAIGPAQAMRAIRKIDIKTGLLCNFDY